MMGTAITLRVPIDTLFWISMINPLQIFKMAAILNIDATLDVLGPAGVYALQHYGRSLKPIFLGALALWVAAPALVAYWRFTSKNDF